MVERTQGEQDQFSGSGLSKIHEVSPISGRVPEIHNYPISFRYLARKFITGTENAQSISNFGSDTSYA